LAYADNRKKSSETPKEAMATWVDGIRFYCLAFLSESVHYHLCFKTNRIIAMKGKDKNEQR
jgi:hypothetical protein